MDSMKPRVVIHNTISLDGRITGFPVDVGLYYRLAAEIPHDAVLSGSGTLLTAARDHGVDLSGEDPPPAEGAPARDGPLLVVVDSGARLRRLAWLRDQPFWRDVVVLISGSTPAEHRQRLRRLRVDHIETGADRVDLAAALAELHTRYAVGSVRVDAGAGLNGHLLAAGLVDELSVVIAPHLAAAGGVPLAADAGSPRLNLIEVAEVPGGQIRARYAVSGRTGATPAD
jgi:2,5-diamino-6-(ribosylamino)-4(3H)-pyrimidinone 5'-phosphate reductase